MAKTSKRETEKSKSATPGGTRSDEKERGDAPPRRQDGTRETIESIVVAFILAFLFRTFEAEAFVIPTGSMAPTLYGRHIEFVCVKCGTLSGIGASGELDKASKYYDPNHRNRTGFCPNCRYENVVFDERAPHDLGLLAFKGDRILVNKFPYEFWEPNRWDVVVFKYPEDPKTNYIKRLVGLPGEEIKIERGDVFVRKPPHRQWQILRKQNPNKQRQLQLLVYDNDLPARELHEWGWPQRWAPVERQPGENGSWIETDQGWMPDARSFEIDSTHDEGSGYDWIRYRHIVPMRDDWDDFENNVVLGHRPGATLITDFCPYNAYTGGGDFAQVPDDIYWVGDLTLNCEVEVRRPAGELLLELIKGADRYRCRIDLSTGQATLFFINELLQKQLQQEERILATAATTLNGPGRYQIAFANVDHRLTLWIDGTLVDLGSNTEYDPPALPGPRPQDLAPVGIAARDASLRVSHLLIQRDVYYRADRHPKQSEFRGNEQILRNELGDPDAWSEEYNENYNVARFEPLADDEFFMLGDNSPRSQDSRLWSNDRGAERRHAVPRSALVGKAFYVYWPRAVPFMNDGRGYSIDVPPVKRFFYHQVRDGVFPEDLEPQHKPYPKFSIPFYPNIGRMHRIR